MVGPLVDWAGAVMVWLAVLLGSLWVMVWALVEWAMVKAMMDFPVLVLGSQWVMVGALVEWGAMRAMMEYLVVCSSVSLGCLLASLPQRAPWLL